MVLGKPLKISELKAAIRNYYKMKQENDMAAAAAALEAEHQISEIT